MNRGLSLLASLAALLLLAGCTISRSPSQPPPGFNPEATRVAAVPPANEPARLDSARLGPGQIVYYEVTVSETVASQSEAIYYDVDVGDDQVQNGANAIAVRLYNTSGDVLASSVSHEGFTSGTSAEPTALDATATFEPQQGVTPDWLCFGPCIVEPSGTGTRYVRLENITDVAHDFGFYSYGLELQDANEPQNNSSATSTPISGVETGAIEFIGDEDYFEVRTNGQLYFDSDAARQLRLRADIVNTTTTLAPGSRTSVIVGDLIRVYSDTDTGWAGSPGASGYSLEIVSQ